MRLTLNFPANADPSSADTDTRTPLQLSSSTPLLYIFGLHSPFLSVLFSSWRELVSTPLYVRYPGLLTATAHPDGL